MAGGYTLKDLERRGLKEKRESCILKEKGYCCMRDSKGCGQCHDPLLPVAQTVQNPRFVHLT